MCSQAHCRNLLPRCQVSNFKRSSCRKRHGQLILVLDLGLRPNDHNRHRARCRSSASTSDEHVSLCASRAGRQRPRRLRFRSDGHHLVYRTLQRRPGERAAFSAARPQPLRPGAVALFPRRGHHPPTPTRLRSALRPTATKVIPTTWRETANHSGGADYRREGRPILAGFACAVNPGGLSGSLRAGG
jgi:hypothetical protein